MHISPDGEAETREKSFTRAGSPSALNMCARSAVRSGVNVTGALVVPGVVAGCELT
ncbi:hypothetical protein EDF62_0662 [Leucobacter luti]|uniref:Uncharacterized protein n=1 Tax=Leucobacter luti TaxID=340320 RepID=A0A4R6S3N4_9MICO|nr:hypothetical protein EDF62_0662 [Leucobacter luti]